MSTLIYNLQYLAVFFLLVWGVTIFGQALLKSWLKDKPGLYAWLIGFVFGLGSLSYLIWILGYIGWFQPTIIIGLTLIAFIIGLSQIKWRPLTRPKFKF